MPRPPYLYNFVGREEELEQLEEWIIYENRRLVIVSGPAGVGKSTLVNEFAHQNFQDEDEMPVSKQTLWIDAPSSFSRGRFPDMWFFRSGGYYSLVVIDGAEALPESLLNEIVQTVTAQKRTRTIYLITTRRRDEYSNATHLELKGLSSSDTRNLLSYYARSKANLITLSTIASKVNNNPLAVTLAADLLTRHSAESVLSSTDGELYTIDELNQSDESGLIKIVRPRIIDASEELIYRIRKTPTDLYGISPREFEILIARILEDMGWEVELTKQSRDGGKDILAYMKTELGLFLCLVEAKKYRPDRPVGIEIVKQLYGTFCDEQANSAMLVTTSRFTRDAHEFQAKHNYQLQLREYAHVVDWLFRFGRK